MPLPTISTHHSITDVLKNRVGVVLATAHDEFKNIAPADFARAGVKVIIDGRNCLDKSSIEAMGISYQGIGR